MNWQVSLREGSGTLTTGRPFWTWIEARTRQLGRRDREGKQGWVRWKEWKGEERRRELKKAEDGDKYFGIPRSPT